MGLETGTFIDDLVITNPLGSDDKREGDDHLRLIKKVLKGTIKRASRAFYIPDVVSKTANYTVLVGDENLAFLVDATAADVDLTLPVLTADDAGWQIYVIKADDVAVIFIIGGGGLKVNGFDYVRRRAFGTVTKIIWDGTQYWASRDGPQVGSLMFIPTTATTPSSYLDADGSAFDPVGYLELAVVYPTGSVPLASLPGFKGIVVTE